MNITQLEIEKYVLGHKLDSMTKKELIEVIIQHAQIITMLHIANDKKQERIDKALHKLRASKDHFKTQRENNTITFVIKILGDDLTTEPYTIEDNMKIEDTFIVGGIE